MNTVSIGAWTRFSSFVPAQERSHAGLARPAVWVKRQSRPRRGSLAALPRQERNQTGLKKNPWLWSEQISLLHPSPQVKTEGCTQVIITQASSPHADHRVQLLLTSFLIYLCGFWKYWTTWILQSLSGIKSSSFSSSHSENSPA